MCLKRTVVPRRERNADRWVGAGAALCSQPSREASCRRPTGANVSFCTKYLGRVQHMRFGTDIEPVLKKPQETRELSLVLVLDSSRPLFQKFERARANRRRRATPPRATPPCGSRPPSPRRSSACRASCSPPSPPPQPRATRARKRRVSRFRRKRRLATARDARSGSFFPIVPDRVKNNNNYRRRVARRLGAQRGRAAARTCIIKIEGYFPHVPTRSSRTVAYLKKRAFETLQASTTTRSSGKPRPPLGRGRSGGFCGCGRAPDARGARW